MGDPFTATPLRVSEEPFKEKGRKTKGPWETFADAENGRSNQVKATRSKQPGQSNQVKAAGLLI
jgi:hypothetical protein